MIRSLQMSLISTNFSDLSDPHEKLDIDLFDDDLVWFVKNQNDAIDRNEVMSFFIMEFQDKLDKSNNGKYINLYNMILSQSPLISSHQKYYAEQLKKKRALQLLRGVSA